ncbi:1,6-anhydro-N-acetylmuramyl-L-alanine amidase AmpD [Propionivibrio sp.]|uniref:1,6-anhydro-N-acetylmuramyl-L-alanine amidase AmpD n=1 Tax=Propionivibrio sp. TaxID=2212460 RepID=UPI0039E3AFD1
MTDGWLDGVRRVPSPNCDDRPEGEAVSLIVIHAISLPPSQFGGGDIERLFTNTLDPGAHPYFAGICVLRVSAHFLIRRDGEVIQFVSCDRRAWHAGVSRWQGRERCNDFSIGIELEGCDELPFEDVQYARLVGLIGRICAYYPVVALAGHADIAPARKTDPGPCFAWRRLAVAGMPPRVAA